MTLHLKKIIRALYEIRAYPGNYTDSLTQALPEGLNNAELALHEVTGITAAQVNAADMEDVWDN